MIDTTGSAGSAPALHLTIDTQGSAGRTPGFLGSLALATLAGTAALLLAPERGTITRQRLASRMRRGAEDFTDQVDNLTEASGMSGASTGHRRRAAVLGMAVGAGITWLFTTPKGARARAQIARGARELGENASERWQDFTRKAKRNAAEGMERAGEEMNEMAGSMRSRS